MVCCDNVLCPLNVDRFIPGKNKSAQKECLAIKKKREKYFLFSKYTKYNKILYGAISRISEASINFPNSCILCLFSCRKR